MMDQPTLINMDDVEVVEINKICPRCKRLKSENEYYPSNRTSDGLTTYCKECHAEMQKEKYANKPPGWHWRTYGKDWYERNKDQELSRALENNYGITLEDKKNMLISQNWRCAICGKKLKLYGRLTHVDHDHDTGKVRGVLCNGCNALLGGAKDDVDILKSAIFYLEERQ